MKNYRLWGKPPYQVAVVHGGPGAPGYMAAVARELSKTMGVLEPLQTQTSIDGQVEELAAVIREQAAPPVTLIGHSWGATLSYVTTVRYPHLVKKLVLVGMPPMRWKDRAERVPIWLERLSENEREELFKLEAAVWDGVTENKSELMGRLFRLITKGDCFEMLPTEDEVLEYQIKANVFIFRELARLTESTQLIDMGKKITCPVTAIHGDSDIRCPVNAVQKPLSPVIKNFKAITLQRCGHYPWLEKFARDEFFKVLCMEI